jgi:hypothetical protein
VQQTRAGAVLVLHEGQPCGPPVAVLADALISCLRAWRLVTIDQLWQARQRAEAG